MRVDLHKDPIARETIILQYLGRQTGPELTDEFESHYLACQECYEQLRAAELLIAGLRQLTADPDPNRAKQDRLSDIAVIRLPDCTQLVAFSLDLGTLVKTMATQQETNVLVDLSTVSRIDSAGLGMLMECYCHAVRNAGILKLLKPSAQVKKVLAMTKMDSVLQTFENEQTALESFGKPAG
jgi:anti-anti-sigma factor